ncbi:uncharacterized protein LOC133197762 [Saccostrea echinata]|uniref:uncharacterized protein LOC133197762 n=1 Tax=Saccostrea echinata TaxID=191078 RepID=UPI002A7F2657|nr:uncharacterized protein LOC133197762 [Saccostrea echinata]
MDRKDPSQELSTKDGVPEIASREDELVSQPEKGGCEKKDASQDKETQDDRQGKIDNSDFDQDVCRLLRKIDEGTLISLFVKERVTMEILMDLNDADLREVGVGTFGQRHKILKAIKEYREKKEKKQKKTLCRLHPFNTTCPGRKRKSHNQTSYGYQCKVTKKMKTTIPTELSVVTSTASSIQPPASVITTGSPSCQTAVTQSCQTLNVSSTTSPLHNVRSSITAPTTIPTTHLAITTCGSTSTVLTTNIPLTTHGTASTAPTTNLPITTNGTSSAISATVTASVARSATTTTSSPTSIIGTLPSAFPAIQNNLLSSTVTTPICSSAIFSQATSNSPNLVTNFSITSTLSSYIVTTSSIGSIAVSSLITSTSNLPSTVSTSLTATSNCAVTVPVTNVLGNPNTITDEENNFLRYYLLAQLGTHALRFLFDSFVPPATLTSHLKKVQTTLKKRCNPQQLTILYPAAGGPVSSTDYDTSLLYTLLRNTVKIAVPTGGWSKEPRYCDISQGDDVERIRFARNSLCHGKSSMDLPTFKSKWLDISKAIGRLSSGSLNAEVVSLSTRKFDRTEQQSILDDFSLLKKRVEKLERKHIPNNIHEQHEKMFDEWKEEQMVFCKTRAFQKVRSEIESKEIVTIISGPGMGKTFIARRVCLQLQDEGWEIIPVNHIEDMMTYRLVSINQVFLLDDPIGVFGFDRSISNSIERIFESIYLSKKTKFIFTCRKSVFIECEKQPTFLKNIIDIGCPDYTPSEIEMKEMLNSHCERAGMVKTIYKSVNFKCGMAMFPLLCRLFSKGKENQKLGNLFFEKPYQSIIEHFIKMRNQNESHYAALILCMLKDNHLKKEEVSESFQMISANFDVSLPRIRRSLKELTGTYVVKQNKIYSFYHDSLFEVVAYLHASKFPGQVLDSLRSSYIANNVLVTEEAVGSSCTNLCICLKKKHYILLAKRLLKDIKDVQFYDVFDGKALKSKEFLDYFISYLDNVSNDDLADLILTIHSSDTNIVSYNRETSDKVKYWGVDYYTHKLLLGEQIITKAYRGKGKGKFDHNDASQFSVVAVSWLICFGHVRLLSYILKRFDNIPHLLNIKKNEGSRLLVLACFKGNVNVVQRLIDWLGRSHINLAPRDTYDLYNEHLCYTPLTAAVISSNKSVIEALVEEGGDVNRQDNTFEGDTPLTTACRLGYNTVVETLLCCKADVNQASAFGRSPLFWASRMSRCELVELLLQRNADVNLSDDEGRCPIHEATERGFLDIVKLLVENNADTTSVDKNGKIAVTAAFEKNHYSIKEYLISQCKNRDPFQDDIVLDFIQKTFGISKKMETLKSNTSSRFSCLFELVLESKNILPPNWQSYCFQQKIISKELSILKCLFSHGYNLNSADTFNPKLLFVASENGYIETVEQLVNQGADVSIYNDDKITPLYLASQNGHMEIVQYLIEHGANVNIYDIENVTPLSMASQNGHTEIVKHLIEHGANVNISTDKNVTPLLKASQNGHMEIIQYLIEHGANVNIYNIKNVTPLYMASQNGHTEIVKHLIEHGANVNIYNIKNVTPLYMASQNGHTEIVKHLIEHGANVNIYNIENVTPLSMASQNGHTEIVKHLIEHGADVNISTDKNVTSLLKASQNGHMEIVQYLIEHGANVNIYNIENVTPLSMASQNGHTEIVKHLIEHGANVNTYTDKNVTSLLIASQNGHMEIVQYLIEHGADVNIFNVRNVTPLFQASHKGHMEIVQYLIEHGADVNIYNVENITPLSMASQNGHTEIVKHLIEHGADVNIHNVENVTSLSIASQNGHTEIVKHLIEHGADVNIFNVRNVTPLFKASQNGHVEIVQYLIEHGADVNILPHRKDILIETVKYLIEHGADINIYTDRCSWHHKMDILR